MFSRARFRPWGRWLVLACVCCAASSADAADAETRTAPAPTSYKAGDKIAYKKTNTPEVWIEAVFLRMTPDGSQPIVRLLPHEFQEEPFEQAASWEDILPLARSPLARAAAKAERPAAAAPAVPAAAAGKPSTRPATQAAGLLTQAEIAAFLQARLGDGDPFRDPKHHERVQQELAEIIKRRGVDFHDEVLSQFNRDIARYSLGTQVSFPLKYNFGPPTKRAWLAGAWRLDKISAAVDFVKPDGIYRQTEFGVKDVGTLTINPDGTYVWVIAAPAGTVSGKWRDATTEEMKHQGGDGLVLLAAKGKWDWIVTQDRVTQLKDDWIAIDELTTRQVSESGRRRPAGK